MGIVQNCCRIKGSNLVKGQSDIEVDIANITSKPTQNVMRHRNGIRAQISKSQNQTDCSGTTMNSTNLRVPKRIRSSQVVLKPFSQNYKNTQSPPKNIKRANSTLVKNKFIQELENRLCNFSKKKGFLRFEPDQSMIEKSDSSIITLIKCEEEKEVENFILPKKKVAHKDFEVINNPLTPQQLAYIKKILFEEEILINEMDEATM